MAVEHSMLIAQPHSLLQLPTNYSLPTNIEVTTCTEVPSDVLKPKPCDLNEEEGVWFIPGFSVTHVLEVLSVKIFNNQHDFDIEIYGQISISDFIHDEDNFTCIYNKHSDDPDALSRTHNVLSISGDLIRPFMNAKLLFNLTNKETGAPLFGSEARFIDYDLNGEYEQESITVQGNDGYYATMEYCTLPFAAIGKVSMFLTTDSELVPDNIINVDGDIKANGLSILGNKVFELSEYRVDGKLPTYSVWLSRRRLAVPVESWLEFQVSLQRGGTDFITGKLVANPRLPHRCCHLYMESKDEKYCFHIEVAFIFPDEYFCLLPKIDRRRFKTKTYYVEVFSVVVGDAWGPVPALYGKILVRDREDSFYIFSREKDRPDNFLDEKYPTRSVLSLAWPQNWLVQAEGFIFNILLQDVQGNLVCFGGFNLRKYPLQFDKRMCCVIPNEEGNFAAVHYSIFRECRIVKVTFEWQGKFSLVVHGSVSAQYGNYQYGEYDDSYYRNIIFKRSEDDRVEVKSRSRMPLSKSLITAPSDCDHLYVYVDLAVQGCNVTYPRIENKLFFKLGSALDSSQQLRVYHDDQQGCFTVSVNWSST